MSRSPMEQLREESTDHAEALLALRSGPESDELKKGGAAETQEEEKGLPICDKPKRNATTSKKKRKIVGSDDNEEDKEEGECRKKSKKKKRKVKSKIAPSKNPNNNETKPFAEADRKEEARKAANRKSAFKSRLRRKMTIQDLNSTVDSLEQQVSENQVQISELECQLSKERDDQMQLQWQIFQRQQEMLQSQSNSQAPTHNMVWTPPNPTALPLPTTVTPLASSQPIPPPMAIPATRAPHPQEAQHPAKDHKKEQVIELLLLLLDDKRSRESRPAPQYQNNNYSQPQFSFTQPSATVVQPSRIPQDSNRNQEPPSLSSAEVTSKTTALDQWRTLMRTQPQLVKALLATKQQQQPQGES
mmetsp:Transcript_17880/g.42189  ORF Transcript_17880/g.42189 Transcript_17880/m.42189 type:complete len:359 (+) Transcript_17880:39-1115(+)